MRNLLLAVLLLGAVSFGQSADDNIVVVGNQSQPVQWTHQNSIQAAIQRAGPKGVVWIPATYAGTDCNPVSSCDPGNTLVIDLRGSLFQTYPPLTSSSGSSGNSGSVYSSTSYYTPTQPFIDLIPDPFGACVLTGSQFDQISDVNGILSWTPFCPNGAPQQVLAGPVDATTNNEDILDQNGSPVPVNFGCVSIPGVYCLSPKFPGLTLDQQVANAIAAAQAAAVYAAIDIDARALAGVQTWATNGFAALTGNGWQPALNVHLQVCNMTINAQVPFVLPGGVNVDPMCGRQAGVNPVGFAIDYSGPPAYWAGLASNTAATGGSGATYQFQVTGSGTLWAANAVPGEIFSFCTSTVTGGECPGTENAPNAASGLILSVNNNTSLTVITNSAVLANTATSCAGSTACNYVIYPPAMMMGDFSGSSAQNQNFDVFVHDVTIQCNGVLGCVNLANYNCSNMCGAARYYLHPSDNIALDIETAGSQQSGPYDPGWVVGKNVSGQTCYPSVDGVVVRTFTAVPQGLRGISVAVNACTTSNSLPVGYPFLIDAPVILGDWHVLPNVGGSVGVYAGSGSPCPYICISQPFSFANGTIGRGDCAASVTTCVEIGTNAAPVSYAVEGPERSGGTITNTFVDSNTGCTILQSSENAVKKYAVDSAGNIAPGGTSRAPSCLPGGANLYEAGVVTIDKMYSNTQTLSSGAATHTFANSFSYTSSSTFHCQCTDQTGASACKAVPASATTVTLAGTGSDVLALLCSGH